MAAAEDRLPFLTVRTQRLGDAGLVEAGRRKALVRRYAVKYGASQRVRLRPYARRFAPEMIVCSFRRLHLDLMSNMPDMPYGLRGCGARNNDQGRRGYRRTDLTRHLNLHFQRPPAL
jgi:hypothetical protein